MKDPKPMSVNASGRMGSKGFWPDSNVTAEEAAIDKDDAKLSKEEADKQECWPAATGRLARVGYSSGDHVRFTRFSGLTPLRS